MKKVLILTAGFGDGHNTAARNVADALEMISDEVKVEVLDVFQSSLGLLNDVLKKTCLGLTRFAPGVWSGIYSMLDSSSKLEGNLLAFGNLKDSLQQVLDQSQPDCVISTYPVYAHVIAEIYRDHSEQPFRLITVVTDSISVNSSWFRAPSDCYCVANETIAKALLKSGVLTEKIRTFGFPVSPYFAEKREALVKAPAEDGPIKILYIIHPGKKKTGKLIDRLLKMPRVHLTIACGRDAELKEKLARRAEDDANRVSLLGWTNQMPRLMLSHHLVVTRAGGATVQEAVAAGCPMILNQVLPGQEDGNARLVHDLNAGVVAERGRDVADWIDKTFENDSELWKRWRQNLAKAAQPDASIRIAELALNECQRSEPPARLFDSQTPAITTPPPARTPRVATGSRMLLCDFHIHTNYSDGKMTAPEVVDFYGKRGFDCICITDHLGDPRRLVGKLSKLLKLTLGPEQMDEYFDVIERERRRAWRKYNMIVMTGLEFNKDGFTRKTSAHLLGVDLKAPVNPALDLPPTIAEIHAQGGLAIASHPHEMKSEWGKNTLYLWENQEVFAPLIDAWEIANRNNIFTPVGLKRLAFLANSDFHKPKHIYSWKTLLHSEKDSEAIKECIRKNDHVAITLYRDNLGAANLTVGPDPQRVLLEEPLALRSLSA